MSEHRDGSDVFFLTPLDVRRYELGSAIRGYDRQRVDQFREQLAEELERLIRVNGELEVKLRNTHEQLKHYRERDKAINEALVSAQQLREDVKEQAAREAELMRREAEQAAQRLMADVQHQVATLHAEVEQLDRTRRAYLAQLRAIAERHIAEADALLQPPATNG
jgi:cell division septum initiation protein DivIVA